VHQWEVKAPMPSSCFRAIVRQISKLHEAIYGLLPSPQVQVGSNNNYFLGFITYHCVLPVHHFVLMFLSELFVTDKPCAGAGA